MAVDVLRKLPVAIPLGIIGVTVALALCEVVKGLAQRLVGTHQVKQGFAQRLVGEDIAMVEILGPDHVGNVVADQAQHRRQSLRLLLTVLERLLGQLSLGHLVGQSFAAHDCADGGA